MKTIRVLVVDDEIVVQRSCCDIFTEKSDRYEIVTVSSGEEALSTLEDQHFNVILTDIKMPGLPGLELVKVIRKRYPKMAIVVITGYATVKTAVQAMKLGAVDFIPKPFTPNEIFNAVEGIVSRLEE